MPSENSGRHCSRSKTCCPFLPRTMAVPYPGRWAGSPGWNFQRLKHRQGPFSRVQFDRRAQGGIRVEDLGAHGTSFYCSPGGKKNKFGPFCAFGPIPGASSVEAPLWGVPESRHPIFPFAPFEKGNSTGPKKLDPGAFPNYLFGNLGPDLICPQGGKGGTLG